MQYILETNVSRGDDRVIDIQGNRYQNKIISKSWRKQRFPKKKRSVRSSLFTEFKSETIMICLETPKKKNLPQI